MTNDQDLPLYSLRNVVYEFGASASASSHDTGSADGFVLGPLDLEISRGRVTSIVGRSGSGKTTLLGLLGLLRRPDLGEITVHLDRDYRVAELWSQEAELEDFRARKLGFALQKGELLPFLSLYENAALVVRFLEAHNWRQRLAEIFHRLYDEAPTPTAASDETAEAGAQSTEEKDGASPKQSAVLKRLMHSKPQEVSQGQYQRAAIARALATEPPIVLADEPTGNLDQHSGRQAMQIFRTAVAEHREKGVPTSVIVVTHDILLALEFAEEIIVLSDGKVRSHYVSTVENTDKLWSVRAGDNGELVAVAEVQQALLADLDGGGERDETSLSTTSEDQG